jgi:transcriptional regulator with XRE-family HTH domain
MKNIEHEALLLVKSKMEENGWNYADLGKKMGMHKSSISKMLQADKIKLGKLMELSELFGYNFLRVLADQAGIDNPPRSTEDHTACQQRIHDLEIENATLLKVLGK